MKKTLSTLFLSMVASSFVFGQISAPPKVKAINLGQSVSDFKLKNVDDKFFDLKSLPASTKGIIMIFMTNSCDHCIMYRSRIRQLNATYKSKGFPLVAVSPLGGMTEKWPLDAFPAMKVTAKDEKFDFPYLSDDQMYYTYLFGVQKTPTALVFKRVGNSQNYTLVYRGAIDNNEKNGLLATRKFVEEAVNKALKN